MFSFFFLLLQFLVLTALTPSPTHGQGFLTNYQPSRRAYPNEAALPLNAYASLYANGFSNGTTSLPPPPASSKPLALLLGRGTQNYTCSNPPSTAAPTPNGALATLFNLTSHLPPSLEEASLILPLLAPLFLNFDLDTIEQGGLLEYAGKHYFNKGGKPVFELSELGVVVAKKVGGIASPFGEEGAVDWLMLERVSGDESGGVVKQVYRVFTAGGKAAVDGCNEVGNGEVEVQYAALYWFYG